MSEPITPNANGLLGEVEQAAADAYRAKYPYAPPWLELNPSTQEMWMQHVRTSRANKGGERT